MGTQALPFGYCKNLYRSCCSFLIIYSMLGTTLMDAKLSEAIHSVIGPHIVRHLIPYSEFFSWVLSFTTIHLSSYF